jgi:hypothetical protein
MKFKPNKYGYLVIGIIVVLIIIVAFKKRRQIKSKIMSTIYDHLFDENGKFKADKSKPRGERNNNPGNLVKTNINWKGKIESERNSDGRFEQFYEMKYGVRALIKDLLNDIKKGKNNLTSLISEFAPAHENNTNAYIRKVGKMTGLNPSQTIPADKNTIKELVKAIAYVENGKPVINDNDFNQAWEIV